MSKVDISPVTTNSDMNEFIDLPWKIYPRESNWVPPLKKDVRRLLDPKRHPFWQFSERELLLARRDSQVIGRIAAIIDHNYDQYHGERMGAWGFFECMNDQQAADALFAAAEQWVKSKGMRFLRGPLNPSTNYEIGLLIEGYQYAPTIMMPWNHPYYLDLVQGCGFKKEKDLIALRISQEDMIGPRIQRLAQRITRSGKVWCRNGSKKNLQSEMSLIADIYKSAWAENWGFVPLTEDETREMARNLVPIMKEELTFFIYYGEDPAGVVMILPDVNPLLKRFNGKIGLTGALKYLMYRHEIRGLRGALLGVKKRYQKLGLPLVAFDHLFKLLKGNHNYDYIEFGWNLEDNDAINKFESEMGAKICKRYRIFRKSW
ncbi:MAG: acyl-CoA N-acyltransferase [Deltaproteobacteria bacterium]|nr:acyl-CoA N-acyltransferase [Deltaproteobacteria bacterium]